MYTASQRYLDIQSRIVDIIYSCTTEVQLEACEKLIDNFIIVTAPSNIYDRFLVEECAIHLRSRLNLRRKLLDRI